MTDLDKILCYENFDTRRGSLESISGFSAADNGTIIEGEGGKIGQTWIARGAEGWGDYGFSWDVPGLQDCESGDEVWWRLRIKFAEDFVIQSEPGMLKGFRLGRVKKSNDDNRGYVDWYIRNDNDNYWRHTVEFERDPPNGSWMDYTRGDLKKGEWQMYEVYCRFHPTDGMMRMWCDGELMGEERRPTIAGPSAESYLQRLLFTTYYNGRSPKTQGIHFDHHTVAVKNRKRDDSVHLSTDSAGNKFLGMQITGGWSPPVDPVDPPVDPVDPPRPLRGTTTHVDSNAVFIATDLPVVVVNSAGESSWAN
jgi:hypothetical protein